MPIVSQYPKKGERVVSIGQTISLSWFISDISEINIFLIKGESKLLISNLSVSSGKGKYSLYIDNSFFSPDFKPCKIRIEMKYNPKIYSESIEFKILRHSDTILPLSFDNSISIIKKF